VQATGVVLRERLARLLASAPVGVIEAPGGYGKTTLLRQAIRLGEVASVAVTLERDPRGAGGDVDVLLAALAAAARRAGLGAVADALASAPAGEFEAPLRAAVTALQQRGEPAIIVVDEIQRASDEAAAWLRRLAVELPPDSGLLVAGRRIPSPLAELTQMPGAVYLGRGELQMSRDEVRLVLEESLGGADSVGEAVDGVLAVTDGWPAAVGLAAALLADSDHALADLGHGGSLIGSLVGRLLAPLDDGVAEELARLAHLPLLDDEVARAVGGDDLTDLYESGLPWSRRADGWVVLPDPVREVLVERGHLDLPARRSAAGVYATRGLLAVAVTSLHMARDLEGVGGLLAGCSSRQLAELGLGPLRVLTEVLGSDHLVGHAGLLTRAARMAEQTDPPLRQQWLRQAVELATTAGDGVVRRAALAELTRDAVRRGDLAETERLATAALEGIGPGEEATKGRVLAALGQLDTIRANPAALLSAERRLEEAIMLFRLAGEREWEADALLRLGYAVSYHGGRFERALAQLGEALALFSVPDRHRGDALTFFAEVLDTVGRPDEAEAAAREALSIGRRLGDSWVIGAACWSAMVVAGHRGDLDATRHWIDQVERSPGPWLEVGAGAEFFMEAADLLAANGDEVRARHYYERARERLDALGLPEAFHQIEVRMEATFGDPERADALLAAVDDAAFAVQRNRWVRRLLRARAAQRRGDLDAAREHAAEAVREVELLGDVGLIWRTEPRLAEQLTSVLPVTLSASMAPWQVTLLGGFEVRQAGTDVSPPPGHPSTLVKLLALRGTSTVDEVIDLLWDDVDLRAGRARLRNLLNRLRDRSGPLVVRQADTLALSPEAEVDAARFETLATQVLAAEPEDRAGLARRCLAMYPGELLPGDRYEDWVTAPRERLRRRFLALVDLVAADALARGDLDDAVALLDAAIEAEPHDESRYVTAGRALLRQGRRAAARALVERAVAMGDDLGVEPGTDLRALAGEVGLNGR
jgi:DNA-binding SARP family transcriptional activator/ATP/maltotriose-dependent transcriptional regulator MalT